MTLPSPMAAAARGSAPPQPGCPADPAHGSCLPFAAAWRHAGIPSHLKRTDPLHRRPHPLCQLRHRPPSSGRRQRCALPRALYPDRSRALRLPRGPAPQPSGRLIAMPLPSMPTGLPRRWRASKHLGSGKPLSLTCSTSQHPGLSCWTAPGCPLALKRAAKASRFNARTRRT
ncbi:hypothetical protein LMCDFJHI_00662 [Aeromonas salmonicida]